MRNKSIYTKLSYIFLFSILLLIYIFISASSYVEAVSSNISNTVFRLHIIANSDSKEDQELKYIVRDKVLEYINLNSQNSSSKESVLIFAKENIETIKEIAKNTIIENGYSYPVDIQIGNFDFPTKVYGDIYLPAGYYDALKIKIGEASGQNWWCVMFPPLCFVDVSSGIVPDSSKYEIQKNLSEEEFALISKTDDNEINFKFKIVELFKNFSIQTAKY